jgi:hypothetical protein
MTVENAKALTTPHASFDCGLGPSRSGDTPKGLDF